MLTLLLLTVTIPEYPIGSTALGPFLQILAGRYLYLPIPLNLDNSWREWWWFRLRNLGAALTMRYIALTRLEQNVFVSRSLLAVSYLLGAVTVLEASQVLRLLDWIGHKYLAPVFRRGWSVATWLGRNYIGPVLRYTWSGVRAVGHYLQPLYETVRSVSQSVSLPVCLSVCWAVGKHARSVSLSTHSPHDKFVFLCCGIMISWRVWTLVCVPACMLQLMRVLFVPRTTMSPYRFATI